jgi:hypothetical protein
MKTTIGKIKMTDVIDNVTKSIQNFGKDFAEKITHLSSETIHWMAVLCLHGATAPNLIGVMLGLTDVMPPIDIVLIVWSALALLFMKAIITKDRLNLITIGLGFMAQAVVMALIFFK